MGESQGVEWETAKPEGCWRETCAPHFPYKINHPPAFHCLCSLNLFLPQHTVRLLWLITAYTLWVGVTYPNNVATVKRGATLATWETWVQSLGQKDPLEEGMVTHTSILAWRISWTEEPDRLQSMGSQRVRHKWLIHTYKRNTEENLEREKPTKTHDLNITGFGFLQSLLVFLLMHTFVHRCDQMHVTF